MKTQTDSAVTSALCKADLTLAQKGKTFHWARHLMGSLHASRATRLYSFCRYIDDLADESSSPEAGSAALLLAAQDVTRGMSDHPVIQDGIDLMRECDIERSIVLELISGVASDLGVVLVADENALLRYCYQVAGTVGLMMCRVLDTQNPSALPHAVDLGIAMQLTNICRDIAADAQAGRRYIPQSMLGDLAPQALICPAEALRPAIRQCVAALLDRADVYYRSAELGLPYLPLGARSGILVAARTYQAIGAQLRRRDYAYWTARAVVRKPQKAAVTAWALLTVPLQRAFWRSPRLHDDTLHTSLNELMCFGRCPGSGNGL
ncbi:phytoene/squalene synthase family protein [Polaromonas sp. DSR2-3-2]|uniref:phytoene/squalene synthase family protein n=1 Tax=unclassified Polaromonas TaxID=2638319 RepID=UPI003CE9F04F